MKSSDTNGAQKANLAGLGSNPVGLVRPAAPAQGKGASSFASLLNSRDEKKGTFDATAPKAKDSKDVIAQQKAVAARPPKDTTPPSKTKPAASANKNLEIETNDEPKKAVAKAETKAKNNNNISTDSNQSTQAQAVNPAAATPAVPVAVNNAPEAGTPPTAKEELIQRLTKILGKGERVLKAQPLLSLISGHLENVRAQDIPNMVTGSGFLQNAFAAGEVSDFLNTPIAAGDLLKQLGMQGLVERRAERLGINLAEQLTPLDLLKAMQIDPQAVQTEINLMKANVQLDGLNQYMLRAERMQQKTAAPLNMMEGMPSIQSPLAQELEQTDTIAPIAPVLVPVAQAPVVENPSTYNPSAIGYSGTMTQQAAQPQTRLARPVQNAAYQPQMTAIKPQAVASASNPAPAAATQMLINEMLMHAIQDQELPMEPGLQMTLPQAATFDPAQAIRNKWAPGSVVKTQFPVPAASFLPPAPSTNLEEILMAQALQQGITPAIGNLPLDAQVVRAGTVQSLPNIGSEVTGTPFSAEKLTKNSFASLQPDQPTNELGNYQPGSMNFNMQNPMNFGGEMPTANMAKPNVMPLKPNTQTLVGALPISAVGGNAEKSNQQLSDGNLASKDFSAGTSTPVFLNNLTGKTELAVDSFQKSVSENSAPTLVNSIKEKVSSLVHQGGGSVHMDLGSKELGKLEVSVNVKNDAIDLKIVTGNEQLRDMLTVDLGKLKESLREQNLHLANVEIGMHREAMLSQSFNQQAQDRQPNPFNYNYNAESSAAEARRSLPQRATHPAASFRNAYKPSHGGQIQVWA